MNAEQSDKSVAEKLVLDWRKPRHIMPTHSENELIEAIAAALAAERAACAEIGYEVAKAWGCDVCCDAVAAKVGAAIRAREGR